MIKNKKYIIAITISLAVSVLAIFAYHYKDEIRIFLELKELKDDNSEKYYYVTNDNKRIEITIPNDADIDDVVDLLKKNGELKGVMIFKILANHKGYTKNIEYGTIILEDKKYGINSLINALRNPHKETINFQIPENIRLIKNMIILIEDSIGYNRGELKSYLDTSDFLKNNNLTLETLPAFFIPNTYQIYKGLSVESFLSRMKKEYETFWNINRLALCDSLGITEIEVSILASIVEEEQDKRIDERPRIAGVYLNRLNNPKDYPKLQADPTVKFANNDFTIKRVLDKHTAIDNPYNTYLYPGFPPGPIRIPSINSIDAVLNAENHTYTFMCAGTNGYHKFTSSNDEHNRNKNKYQDSQGW